MTKIVIIESPYAGDVDSNVAYARQCMRHSLLKGESPFASHLLYTQDGVLDDLIPHERDRGIKAGFEFKRIEGALTVFYIDRGWSKGMYQALEYCKKYGLPYVERSIV